MNAIANLIRATLIVLLLGNVMVTNAQTETPSKPAATGATVPGQKPEAKPSSPITGTIKGRIVASDGQPLTNVNVMAQSLTGTPATKPTLPNAEGRFAFDDLAPGAYILIATAPGYIDESMSLGDPSAWPRHLIGSNVKINMIRGGVITGLVTNAKGEPLVGIPVRATITNAPASSVFSFVSGGGVSETDDRGSYRIYGLLPGQYTVNAGGNGPFGQFMPSGFDKDVPTYYPSSTRDTAVPVSVRSGDETTGIDLKYKGSEGYSISGVVLGDVAASARAGTVTIMLAHAGSGSVLSMKLASVGDPRRAFGFDGVADGEYDVFAGYLVSQTDNALMGTKRITVRGGDVTGIELRLATLGSLAGTITLGPIKPQDKCDKRGSQVMETILKLPPDDRKKAADQPLTAMYSGLGQLNEKGEFVLRNLQAARYRLDIKLPSESWYVREINLPAAATRAQQTTTTTRAQATAENAGGWQGIVTIKSGESLSGVSIIVGQDAAGLRGRIAPEGTAIREGTRVRLVPVERELANNVLRYSETFVKSDGTFALTNLAPGRYFALARVEALTETERSPRPIAWDAAARAKLRSEAEAANTIVELKPCQQAIDYQLKIGG
ncbi:MAG: carboxypeptidase regulatory-like domain-containing protein [Pyrinomonadaceae bacterium]